MALQNGVDIVIELPFCFAVRSAYYFARGALELLNRTGVVSHLAFGCENNTLPLLKTLANVLNNEPEDYKILLKRHLSRGLSYPLARSRSLQTYLNIRETELNQLLLGSNNILAIEYLRVIMQEKMPILPLPILRQGSSYHDLSIAPYASATAIRYALRHNGMFNQLITTMPESSWSVLKREVDEGRAPVESRTLEQIVITKLRMFSRLELKEIYEITEGLENRFIEASMTTGKLDELQSMVKSKRYNLTRIQRSLLYILFSITTQQILNFDNCGPQYIHLLGFSAKGQKILQEMKNKSCIKMLNRGSDFKAYCENQAEPQSAAMAVLDRMTTDVYTMLYPDSSQRRGLLDYTTSPLRL